MGTIRFDRKTEKKSAKPIVIKTYCESILPNHKIFENNIVLDVD